MLNELLVRRNSGFDILTWFVRSQCPRKAILGMKSARRRTRRHGYTQSNKLIPPGCRLKRRHAIAGTWLILSIASEAQYYGIRRGSLGYTLLDPSPPRGTMLSNHRDAGRISLGTCDCEPYYQLRSASTSFVMNVTSLITVGRQIIARYTAVCLYSSKTARAAELAASNVAAWAPSIPHYAGTCSHVGYFVALYFLSLSLFL